MLRSLYLTLVYLAFIALGAAAPFVFSLGYVWVDTFRPQQIAYLVLNRIPVSMIMGGLAVGAYLLVDRRDPAPFRAHTGLTLLFGIWVTITTLVFAVDPASAWGKWDWAFKTIMFSAFIPLVFRSRIQLEAFLSVYLFAALIHILPVGLKTLISGGGYGRTLGVVGGNSGFSEGSTLAAVSLMLVPIALYLRKHGSLLPKSKIFDLMYIGLVVVMVACAIGTYSRTGLVGIVVLAGAVWLRSDRKIVGLFCGAAMAFSLLFFTSDTWNERVSTINEYQTESSALGRILVWQWTLGFVAENPAGGGFNSFRINEIRFPPTEAHPDGLVTTGKAFHSIYFEVLGEHGWPGLVLFGGLILSAFFSLQRVAGIARKIPEMGHCRDLAFALQVSMVVILACGSFVGIAFQPMLWYLFALSACLSNYASRVGAVAGERSEGAGWRVRSASATATRRVPAG